MTGGTGGVGGVFFSHGCGMIGGFWCGKGGEDDWLVRCIARQFV